MNISTIIVAIIVVGAAAYLINHIRKVANGTSGCACNSGSSHCSACAAHNRKNKVQQLPPCCQNKHDQSAGL